MCVRVCVVCSRFIGSWNKRYFVIQDASKELLYYKTKGSSSAAGGIDLDSVTDVQRFDDVQFLVESPARNFFLRADTKVRNMGPNWHEQAADANALCVFVRQREASRWVTALQTYVGSLRAYRHYLKSDAASGNADSDSKEPCPGDSQRSAATMAQPAAPPQHSGESSTGSDDHVPYNPQQESKASESQAQRNSPRRPSPPTECKVAAPEGKNDPAAGDSATVAPQCEPMAAKEVVTTFGDDSDDDIAVTTMRQPSRTPKRAPRVARTSRVSARDLLATAPQNDFAPMEFSSSDDDDDVMDFLQRRQAPAPAPARTTQGRDARRQRPVEEATSKVEDDTGSDRASSHGSPLAATSPASVQHRGSTPPAGVAMDANWVHEDWDDDDDDDDGVEGGAGSGDSDTKLDSGEAACPTPSMVDKAASLDTGASRKDLCAAAGVTVDDNFVNEDWDDSEDEE